MKKTEDLRIRMKELSKQAVEFRKQASEIYGTDKEQAKHLREQAQIYINSCEDLRQEIKHMAN